MTEKDDAKIRYVDQLDRQIKLTDQMASQHAFLRDKFQNTVNFVDIVAMIFSGLLAVMLFADLDNIRSFYLLSWITNEWLGLFSLIVFISSLISWKLDWKNRASSHKDAFELLISLKQSLKSDREIDFEVNQASFQKASEAYQSITSRCVPIPEKYFLMSKQYHRKKVAVSKEISLYPHKKIWLIRVCLSLKDNFTGLKGS